MPAKTNWRQHEPLAFVGSLAAIVVAVSLFIASAVALNLNLLRVTASFGWVQHTNDVLLQIAAIEANVIDAESAERGFLLTADGDYLAPFDQAQAALGQQLDALEPLVSDNAGQLARARDLRPLIDARMAEFKRAIEIGPSRLDDALAVIRSAKERHLTQAAHTQLEAMRETELGLLNERQLQFADAARLTTVIAVAAGILGPMSAGLGLFLFERQRSRHRIRELRNEFLHVSRLNTMGQTASMVAHETKQPLTATRNYLQAARRLIEVAAIPQSAKIDDALKKATAQVDRATEIIGRLRRFVERREAPRRAEKIDSVIDEAIALMAIDPEDVTIRRLVDTNLPLVLVDRIEVQQVLINLMRNAMEAMVQSPRRELTCSATLLLEEAAIRVSVQDTGPGLPLSVSEQLFRPFVSTKESGMGVGLSICRTIIEDIGGRIWVTPNPEGGTIFHFTLPTKGTTRDATPRASLGVGLS